MIGQRRWVYTIDVLPPGTLGEDNAGVPEVLEDGVRGPLSDARGLGNLADGGMGIARDLNDNVSVVGEETPSSHNYTSGG
jgi:hypothetical protein